MNLLSFLFSFFPFLFSVVVCDSTNSTFSLPNAPNARASASSSAGPSPSPKSAPMDIGSYAYMIGLGAAFLVVSVVFVANHFRSKMRHKNEMIQYQAYLIENGGTN